jgi:uncharacterized protein (DUF2345 family)
MKHGSDDYRRLIAELSVAVSSIHSSVELNGDAWARIEGGGTAVARLGGAIVHDSQPLRQHRTVLYAHCQVL